MYFKNLSKHYLQIKKGGFLVIFKKFISIFYLFFELIAHLISIPVFIIITLIRPWYLIRWHKLYSSRIGHFALYTELYCCERDANLNFPEQKYKDIFYLDKYVCNKTLENMWKRKISVLPAWLIKPIHNISNLFLGKENIHTIQSPTNVDRDVHNLLERFSSHISFTSEEEIKGKKLLEKLGLPKNAKFVCLIVRDSGYLNRHGKVQDEKRWNYHNYRDGDIEKYILAAEELASRGYYVFRMGINVLKPLRSSNPKIIDYANSGIRSDFMDVYLGAKCTFCISTACGFDAIPTIFRRPVAMIEVPIGLFFTSSEKILLLTKHLINKLSKKELTISEIFSSNVGIAQHSKEYEDNNVEILENSPEEIRDFIIEMDERLKENWKETDEDIFLQKKFWSVFERNMSNLDPNLEIFQKKFLKFKLHGKIKAKFTAKYLRENKSFIN